MNNSADEKRSDNFLEDEDGQDGQWRPKLKHIKQWEYLRGKNDRNMNINEDEDNEEDPFNGLQDVDQDIDYDSIRGGNVQN